MFGTNALSDETVMKTQAMADSRGGNLENMTKTRFSGLSSLLIYLFPPLLYNIIIKMSAL